MSRFAVKYSRPESVAKGKFSFLPYLQLLNPMSPTHTEGDLREHAKVSQPERGTPADP